VSDPKHPKPQPSVRGLRKAAVASAALAAWTTGPALAGPPTVPELPEGQTVGPYVYGGSLYDSNVFRFSGEDEARAQTGSTNMSDIISRGGAGLRARIPVSLQTMRFSGWLERDHYNRFDQLNHNAADADAAWDWQAGRRFSGTLDAGYSRGIRSFDENQTVEKDLRTGRRASADAGMRFANDWKALVGADWHSTNYDQSDNLDRRVTTTFGELQYLSLRNTRLGLRAEHTIGNVDQTETLPNGSIASDDYSQNQYSAVVGWEGSSKSYLKGRLGYTQRNYDDIPARDFGGVTARATYHWQPTVLTGFRFSAWRELQSLDDQIATYVVSRGASVEPIWKPTTWITVRGRLAAETRDFQGDRTGAGGSDREDKVRTVGVGIDYALRRNLALSLDAKHEFRNSNVDQSDYDYDQISAGIGYAF